MFKLCRKSAHGELQKKLATLTISSTLATAILLITAIWLGPSVPELLGKAAFTFFILSCLFFVSFLVVSFYKKN